MKFQLVVAMGGPCFESERAKFGGELTGIAVDRDDAFGADGFDAVHETGVVGVIGKGDDFIDAVAKFCAGLQCPAAEHRGAFGFESKEFF